MTPEIQALKDRLAREREHMTKQAGHMFTSSANGPVGFAAIDAVIAVVEAQQREIEALKAKTAHIEPD